MRTDCEIIVINLANQVKNIEYHRFDSLSGVEHLMNLVAFEEVVCFNQIFD